MTEPLEKLRARGFAIAYRMLGSVNEAEDVVQEAMLRLHGAREAGEEIASPRAYLSTIVTRLAINTLRSARVRREAYVGEWLPEPVVTGSDPALAPETAQELSVAFLALLERLSPEQRAAFLLREVFDYGYPEIARILGKSEVACRQLASRARRQVRHGRPRFEASPKRVEELAERFFAAVEQGDLHSLEALLERDVSLHGDGGGRVPALPRARWGRGAVARTLVNWGRLASRIEGSSIQRVRVNGHPGGMSLDRRGRVVSVLALDIVGDRVRSIHSIVNPDKLRHLGPVADFGELLRELRGSPSAGRDLR